MELHHADLADLKYSASNISRPFVYYLLCEHLDEEQAIDEFAIFEVQLVEPLDILVIVCGQLELYLFLQVFARLSQYGIPKLGLWL